MNKRDIIQLIITDLTDSTLMTIPEQARFIFASLSARGIINIPEEETTLEEFEDLTKLLEGIQK